MQNSLGELLGKIMDDKKVYKDQPLISKLPATMEERRNSHLMDAEVL